MQLRSIKFLEDDFADWDAFSPGGKGGPLPSIGQKIAEVLEHDELWCTPAKVFGHFLVLGPERFFSELKAMAPYGMKDTPLWELVECFKHKAFYSLHIQSMKPDE